MAPFLLTHALLPNLKKSPKGRVIIVSSISQSSSLDFDNLQQQKGYSAHNAYSISKLADAMIAYELADKLQGTGVTVNTLDPGTVNTKMLLEGYATDLLRCTWTEINGLL
uniref:Protochlorophyllide reductase n=2 Tax=Lotharella globosa TaxID=91324 RepID=A0A7S3Y966_9EUKA